MPTSLTKEFRDRKQRRSRTRRWSPLCKESNNCPMITSGPCLYFLCSSLEVDGMVITPPSWIHPAVKLIISVYLEGVRECGCEM